MRYFSRRYLPLWVAFFSVALVFQNCSQVRYTHIAKRNVLEANNNGGSYEGKLEGQYYRFVPGFTCEQRQAPLAVISIFNTSITLTTNTAQNCSNSIQDINSSLVEGSVYQKDIIGYLEGIYESKRTVPMATPAKIVEFWCRDRNDHDGLEVISYHDGISNTSSAKVHYANSNGDGTYTQVDVPEFVVSSVSQPQFSKNTVSNAQNQFQMIVHFDQESLTKPGQFGTQLEVRRNGQLVYIETLCRLGGRFDPY